MKNMLHEKRGDCNFNLTKEFFKLHTSKIFKHIYLQMKYICFSYYFLFARY